MAAYNQGPRNVTKALKGQYGTNSYTTTKETKWSEISDNMLTSTNLTSSRVKEVKGYITKINGVKNYYENIINNYKN